MPLEQDKCESILAALRGMDVQKKLDSINKAREMFTETFSPGMTVVEYAYSAMIIEQFYNLIRDELRVNQIRIKKDLQGTSIGDAPVPKAKGKPKSKTTPTKTMDMATLMAAFNQFKGKAEG